jgi:hypothetical protein
MLGLRPLHRHHPAAPPMAASLISRAFASRDADVIADRPRAPRCRRQLCQPSG